jgi:large subunit ribosomal protein L22
MAEAIAKLSNYRQSPRKVRLIADLIRGKSADRAIALLANLPKRGSEPMQKLVRSAIANAQAKGIPSSELYVSEIQVNGGVVFKRMMPRARGRGAAIRKKSSHITLALSRKGSAKFQAPSAK